MSRTFEECVAVAVSPEAVQVHGRSTRPATFGVYRVPDDAACERRYRFGSHPSRALALVREFGGCELVHLFLEREQADVVARHLNGLPPPKSRRLVVTEHPASEEAQAMVFDDVEPLPGHASLDAARSPMPPMLQAPQEVRGARGPGRRDEVEPVPTVAMDADGVAHWIPDAEARDPRAPQPPPPL